jgi:peroxiredoxin
MGVKHLTGAGIVLLVAAGWLNGQPFMIQGNIEYADQGTVYLAAFHGDRFTVADSVETASGSFYFILPEEAPAGVYRIIYPEVFQGISTRDRMVEFIYNQSDVTMNITLEDSVPMPHFEDSPENHIYFGFMTYQMDYEERLMKVYGQLSPVRPGDPVFESAVENYRWLQEERLRYMDSVSSLYPDLYAVKIMNAFRAPVVSGTLSHAERIDTLKKAFFTCAGIDDPAMLNAPVYTFRIVDYLSLYRRSSLTMAQQEEEFIVAVDQIMAHVGPYQELRTFVVEFMLEGFELLGMEAVQLHLAENYLDESCVSDVATMVRSRMEGYRKMAVGSAAPDLVVTDLGGNSHRISEIPDPYVLLVFWASNCPHCAELIPELHRWYLADTLLGAEVVAISLDSSEAGFMRFTGELGLQWITVRDPQGFFGEAALAYHIYATPMMFLLDNKRTILSKPATLRELQRELRKLER